MVQDRAIFTMADQQKVAYGLSNGAIFNDLERPLTWFLRSHHSLTLNIWEMVKDTARVNPLRLYMRTRPQNGFTSSDTTHTIHATGSRAKLSTKKSIKSIAVDQSRVERGVKSRVNRSSRSALSWIDPVARLIDFRV